MNRWHHVLWMNVVNTKHAGALALYLISEFREKGQNEGCPRPFWASICPAVFRFRQTLCLHLGSVNYVKCTWPRVLELLCISVLDALGCFTA
eukprot:6206959-Pleurochrysis_carterae.AAC.1